MNKNNPIHEYNNNQKLSRVNSEKGIKPNIKYDFITG